MNIRCPSCQTMFRVDPARVPAAGVRARCSRCGNTFAVTVPQSERGGAPTAGLASPVGSGATAGAGPQLQRDAAGGLAGGAEGGRWSSEARAPGVAPAPGAAHGGGAAAYPGARGVGTPTAEPPRAPAPGVGGTAATGPAPPLRPLPGPPAAPPTHERPSTASPGKMAAPAPVFGSRDPEARAQRIARALVSDIVAYHPERRDACLAAGNLRTEFREEIMKSWEEYVAQVGNDVAKSTPHFRNALNDILAKGQRIF